MSNTSFTSSKTSGGWPSKNPSHMHVYEILIRICKKPRNVVRCCKAFIDKLDYPTQTILNKKRRPIHLIKPNCIHTKLDVEDVECFTFGTLDKDNRYFIKKDVLVRFAMNYMNERNTKRQREIEWTNPKEDVKSLNLKSTKIKSYHIAFISSFYNKLDEFQVLIDSPAESEVKAKYMIRHLCGCRECANPLHMAMGSDTENKNDFAYHRVRDKLTYAIDYIDDIKDKNEKEEEFYFIKDIYENYVKLSKNRPPSDEDIII